MGREFDVEYDDFSGGHFVGPSNARQPMNTWTGTNVVTTVDEGFLMPAPAWSVSQPSSGGLDAPPVMDETLGAIVTVVGNTKFVKFLPGAGSNIENTMSPTPVAGPTSTGQLLRVDVSGVAYYAYTSLGRRTLINRTTGAITDATPLIVGGPTVVGLWQWGVFVVAFVDNRLYFSNAGDLVTTWPANNFVDIGAKWSVILGLVVTADLLYVATTTGWFAVSGVLGQTTTVRKLSRIPMINQFALATTGNRPLTYYGSDAAETQDGIIHRSGPGDVLRVLRGSSIDPAMFLPEGITLDKIANAGDVIIATDTLNRLWIKSEVVGSWRCLALPTIAGIRTRWAPVLDESIVTSTVNVVAQVEQPAFTYTTTCCAQAKTPTQPVASSGVFPSATVDLAPIQRNRSLRAREMLVEVDFGQPATQTASRSLTAQLVADPVLNMDPTFGRTASGDVQPVATTAQTVQWTNATATRNGDRQMLRFGLSDVANGVFSLRPRITMQGVKVRRVIVRCEEN